MTVSFLDKLISSRLDSDENARCVLVTHPLNPWGVLKGYSPDFDGVDGITRFRNDCIKAFYKRANYIYEHDGGGSMTINQLIDDVLDEFEIHKPYKDFDLPLGEAVAKNQNIVRDIISKEIDDDVALMLFEHYCSNMVEAINGYVPTTRDNVDIVTAFYYDVCDEADKRVDNKN